MLKIYVLVTFWMFVLGFIVRMVKLSKNKFPETKQTTLGQHLFKLIIGIMYAVWAGIALWGGE